MKIVIHSQYFPPEIGAAPNRLSALVQGLTNAGHEVTVLTAMPNYPAGHCFPGYGGLVRRERNIGSDVVRTFIYPTQSAGMVKRLLCYFSFVFSSVAVGGFFCASRITYSRKIHPSFKEFPDFCSAGGSGPGGYLMSRICGLSLLFAWEF